MTGERQTGKDLEGSDCGLIGIISRPLPGDVDEISRCSSRVSNRIPPEHKVTALIPHQPARFTRWRCGNLH